MIDRLRSTLRSLVGSSRKRGVFVATACNAVSATVGFLFIPEYIRHLGIESVAYVGILTSLLAFASIADLGMGAVLSFRIASAADPRQLSRQESTSARRILTAVTAIAILVAVSGIVLRELFGQWLIPPSQHLVVDTSSIAVLTGFCLAARILESVARGSVIASGRQAQAAIINVCFTVARVAGVLLVISEPNTGLLAFVAWNAGALVVSALCALVQAWFITRPRSRSSASQNLVIRAKSLATGAFATSVLGVVAIQADRVYFQGRISELDMAAYCLATSVLSVRGMLIVPMIQAFMPLMTRHLASGQRVMARELFEQQAKLQSCAIIPPLLVLCFMPEEFLFAWTESGDLAKAGADGLRLLSVAAILNSLSAISHAAELASGATSQGLRFAASGCLINITCLFALTRPLGSIAGGVGHVVSYCTYLSVFAPRIVGDRLGCSPWLWIKRATSLPVLVSLTAIAATFALIGVVESRLACVAKVGLPIAVSWLACIWFLKPWRELSTLIPVETPRVIPNDIRDAE